MPPASSGKIITAIKIKKKGIEVTFDDDIKTKVIINYDIYCDYYLYEGKEIAENIYQEILQKNEMHHVFMYALRLVSSANYTTLEIRDKLIRNKRISYSEAKKIIDMLLQQKLLDDKRYQEEYVEYALEKNKSQKAIKEHLKKKGIHVNDELFSDELESANAKETFLSYLGKTQNYSYTMQKNHLYEVMIRAGFSSSVTKSLIEEHIIKDEEKEKQLLKADYLLAVRKYSMRYENEKLKQYIISFLERKGYYYSDIINIMEAGINELD